jgi:hypothetical protein
VLYYPEFFASVSTHAMSAFPNEPPRPKLTSTTTNEEALNVIRNQIIARRHAAKEKSSRLNVRLEEEEAKLEALAKEHMAGDGLNSALAARIAGTMKLLENVKWNYKVAYDDFTAGYDLGTSIVAISRLLTVEQRLRL